MYVHVKFLLGPSLQGVLNAQNMLEYTETDIGIIVIATMVSVIDMGIFLQYSDHHGRQKLRLYIQEGKPKLS